MKDDTCPYHTIFPILEQAMRAYPEKEAIVDDFRRLSYRQLYDEAKQIAAALNAAGIHRNDKVIVCLPNRSEFISVFFATAKTGAVMIPCNPECGEKEWDAIFSHTEIKAVFCTNEKNNLNYFLNKKIEGRLKLIVGLNVRHQGLFSFDEFIRMGRQHEHDVVATAEFPDQVNVILFTSGSTGKPKGVMLTANNLLFSANNVSHYLRCSQKDIFFVPVPVFHVFGLIPGILTPLLSSGTIVLPSAFHAEQALATIQKEKITVHYGVPAMFILEVRHEHFGKTDFRSLRTGLMAGATCPPGLVKKIWTEMNCHVILSYGATETSGGVTFTDFRDDEKHRFQSAGAVVPGAKIKIVDEERSELPVNKVGELACSGQGIMKGYFQHPDDPALTSDGWYYTGDLAKVDDEGYLYIVGRKKDMIIRGGYNVYPWELEALYQAHPAVDEVSVIGLPDTVLGEVICAVIKLNADSKIKTKRPEERMKDFLKTKVASCKIPDHVLFIDRFPLNGSGKIDKRTLRETCTHALKGALR